MDLVSSKKIKDAVFCSVCEKERKHMLNTYEGLDNDNELYTVQMQKCKSCGNETELV